MSLLSILCAVTGSCNNKPAARPRLDKSNIPEIIKAMTLHEKAMLVTGTGMDIPPSLLENLPEGENPFGAVSGQAKEPDPEYDAMVNKIKKIAPGAAGRTAEIPDLGIPTMVVADGPAGLRINPDRDGETQKFFCTAFPIATLLASTWDTGLVTEVGGAMGNEVLEYGVDAILGPGMNLHRNPLCGRNFEYYSEDPVVTGKMAAAMVNGIQSKGVGTSIKHFAANNQETNRLSVDTVASERALRELYLEGFRIAVQEANPWTVMSSYNRINGTYASENHDLLTKILRDEWGFKGFVMTDWGGGADAIAQMKAGNDLIMPGNREQSTEIEKAVKEGRLDEKILDQNIERIITILVKTPRFNGYKYTDKPDLAANALAARRAAADGMILLKNNENALPFTSGVKNVAVFGNSSYRIITGGTGSGDVNEGYSISLVDGLKNANYSVDANIMDTYLNYINETEEKQEKPKNAFMGRPRIPEMKMDTGEIKRLANSMDIALVTIGRISGEGGDRRAEPGDFYLTDDEKALIRDVSAEFRLKNKKTIIILNIGGVIEVASWRDYPDAILLAWQPGQETGNAIADILSGKVNPSGKLTSTFPVTYDDVPSSKTFPGIELPMTDEEKKANDALPPFIRRIPARVGYEEDIYVGYRYYDTFNVPVSYEFGYGLSYTSFEYSNIKPDKQDFRDSLNISVDIKNTGDLPGREAVQLYVSAPSLKMNKPVKELKAFAKTRLLNPGETETVTFRLDARSLASFDTERSSWVAEAGEYKLLIGASSRDIRQSALFHLENEITVKQVQKLLSPLMEINRLRP